MAQFEIAILVALCAGLLAAIAVVAAYLVGSPTPAWLAALATALIAAAVLATTWAAFVS